MADILNNPVRLATLGELRKTILPNFLAPVPSTDTLRSWFDGANIPRFKANTTARRGGGTVYYQVAGVEKFLRSRLVGRD
jgi:trehalose utilization protein